MTKDDLPKLFPIHVPIKDGAWWNGKPDEFSNIGWALDYSQKFGLTPYAKTGVYGYLNGQLRPHDGLDFAGFEGTPIVAPCRCYITFVGSETDKDGNLVGYGHYVRFETETITKNGDTVKIEYVLAHFRDLPKIQPYKWLNAGDYIGPMGKTGMSTGPHTHFGGRPWIRTKDGNFEHLVKDEAARGYIDLEPAIIEELIYDKQILINQAKFMALNEKKIIIEGEAPGRKGIIVNGKLREIKDGREADACLYALANNGLGLTVSAKDFDKLPKGANF